MFEYYILLAWKRFRTTPIMVALVVLTMVIGIAACITALTIFHALESQPLPGVTDRLYVVTMDAREAVNKEPSSYNQPDSLLKLRDAKALVDTHRIVEQAAVAKSLMQIVNPDGRQYADVYGLLTYGAALHELGVVLRYGRSWTEAEQTAGVPVAVIGSDLAVRLFGTANAVGRSVEINKSRFRVIGVTASWKPRTAFINAGPDEGLANEMQVFLPIGPALDAGIGPLNSGECDSSSSTLTARLGSVNVERCRWLEVWVKLETPAAVASYQRFLANYADAQHGTGRFVHPARAKLYGTRAWIALNHVIPDDVTLNLVLASGFLLLCMINVAGLLTARFMRRQQDVAIRRALGASYRQVFAQHLVESGLLGFCGGALALPLALLGMWIVRKQPASYSPAAHFSPSMFVALFVLSLVVGMIVGVLPAWRVCRLSPAMQIKQE